MPVTFAGWESTSATGYSTYTVTYTVTANDTGPTTTAYTVWPLWNETYTSSSSTTSFSINGNTSWSFWNQTYAWQPDVVGAGANLTAAAPMTPEQILESQRRAEEYARIAREVAARDADERRVAIIKAQALLEGMLTSEQIATLAAQRWFDVISQKGRTYRVHQGQIRNVRRVNPDGSLGMTYCIHPAEAVPDEDAMLAQMLLLQTDEDAFCRIANKS